MSTIHIDPLEELVRDCQMGQLIDWYSLETIKEVLEQTAGEAKRRYANDAFGFSSRELRDKFDRFSDDVRAFFQAFAATFEPALLVMAWEMIQGIEIETLEVSFKHKCHFSMQVKLRRDGTIHPDWDEHADTFESENIFDLRLVRHFVPFRVKQGPLIASFHSLFLRSPDSVDANTGGG